jgi:hypothetical protein
VAQPGPVVYRYRTPEGATGLVYSDRDSGWATDVSGVADDGSTVSRVLWGFGDSLGYDTDTGTLWPSLAIPANSYGFSTPGSDPTIDGLVSPVTSGADGQPNLFESLIPGLDNDCTEPLSPHPREWIRGMVTLPDNEPGRETVLIFYQNFCINFLTFPANVVFGSSGVALAQWDPNQPDSLAATEKLTEHWFLPGVLTDERSGATYPSFSYGSGPVVVSEAGQTFLVTYLCGAGGDCTVARAPITPNRPGRPTALDLADTDAWRYRTADGGWSDFPAPGPTGTCVPTAPATCGGFPDPMIVADAVAADPLTKPAAEPSVKEVDGRWYLLYSAGIDNGTFVYRTATNPSGPFGDPQQIQLAPGDCAINCRAPIWQPAFDDPDRWAIGYYDNGALDGLIQEDDRGRIAITYIAAPST